MTDFKRIRLTDDRLSAGCNRLSVTGTIQNPVNQNPGITQARHSQTRKSHYPDIHYPDTHYPDIHPNN